MSHDEDYLFALQLQKELDAEEENAANDVSISKFILFLFLCYKNHDYCVNQLL